MFVTETINIDLESINNISLEDLILLKLKSRNRHFLTNTIWHIILLKKISNYLKTHPESQLYKLPLGRIMEKVMRMCQYDAFIRNLKVLNTDCQILFYADRALEILDNEVRGDE